MKAAVSLDPWYLPVRKLVEKNSYYMNSKSPPTLVINTEDFGRQMDQMIGTKVYSQKKCSDLFRTESEKKGKLEQCVIKDSIHSCQSDNWLLRPVETSTLILGKYPVNKWREQFLVNNYLVVEFLHRTGIIQNKTKSLANATDMIRQRVTENQDLLKYECRMK